LEQGCIHKKQVPWVLRAAGGLRGYVNQRPRIDNHALNVAQVQTPHTASGSTYRALTHSVAAMSVRACSISQVTFDMGIGGEVAVDQPPADD
jgi:hypothetical protein